MNVCNLACLIATGLFSSKVYLMVNYKKNTLLNQFNSILSNVQKTRYEKIMKDRLDIYISGMVYGLLLGLIYLNIVKKKTTGRACMFTVIVLGVNYLYYILKPKKDYMVPHLTTKPQREAWLAIYKEMQYRCKMGFVLGIVAFMLYGLFLNV